MSQPVLDSRPEWLGHLIDAIDAKDAAKFASYISEDGQFVYGSQPPVEGRAAIEEAVRALFESVKSLRHSLRRCWSMPGTLLCEGSVTYTRLDGRQVTLPFLNVFDMEDGRIRRYQVFVDPGPLFAPTED